MTNEEAYNIISEFCFTGYEDNKKPSFKLFGAIHELILDVEENTKLKAEIEQLKEVRNKYGLLLEMYDKKQKEIKQLKSELEQSVKGKSEVISKIEYALNECEPVYNKCAVVPQVKSIYDLAMNYCLDLLKGETNGH